MNTKIKKQLVEFLHGIEDLKQFENCLRNLLTQDEINEMANRLEIFKLLHKGETQRAVAKKLNVSIATVTRGSKELQARPNGVLSVFGWWAANSRR
jgi:Trp operon repressor